MTCIEARGLSKVYRAGSRAEVRALDEVSLCIEPGSFVVIRGPSGSGKTTLLALLGALERPTRGEVLFHGRSLTACSDVERARCRRRIGFIFQNYALIAGLPAWENVTYPLIPCGVPRAQRQRIAVDLLSRLGLGDRLAALPEQLSGGEQQRVGVARALAGQPSLLIADEPTSNLDPESGAALVAMLRELHGQSKTLIVSSHDPRLLDAADTVHRLARGRLTQ
jgi:putative ABC transport system ATP-binding protein